ncbi:hypothetical protein JW796_03815 [Candidatus Dojkabacteria bacterium]|nr:hypothetical protein [Candidatus Dojkabacteria bacterium]
MIISLLTAKDSERALDYYIATMEQTTDSEQRQELERHINEVITDLTGSADPIFSTVLSYFPQEAELFIETQLYASEKEGKMGIRLTVEHREAGFGFKNKEYYGARQLEYLHINGSTGAPLWEVIKEIKKLRGEVEEKKYGANSTVFMSILNALN